jgi:hypothetical protein
MFLGHFATGKGFWILVGLLGPPPPSVAAIAITQLALAPVLWFWANRVCSIPEAPKGDIQLR